MRKSSLIMLIIIFLMSIACVQAQESQNESNREQTVQEGKVITGKLEVDFSGFKVTFIELGADKCIPCRRMQPIMKEIAEEFAGQVQVVFYDVWKDPRPARKYGIQLIPTQVFIDKDGKEFFRHVGFFPKEEIVKILKKKGIN